MKRCVSWGINALLIVGFMSLAGMNLGANPFAMRVAQAEESECSGDPPSSECKCCPCGCWVCP